MIRHLLAVALATSVWPAHADQKATTETTLATGLPRAPEQEAVTIELADLSFRVDPSRKSLAGDATLTLRGAF